MRSSPVLRPDVWPARRMERESREARILSTRRAASLIETLVVMAIIGTLVALLLPAVQAARRRALEVGCKNDLRQINLAVAQYAETHNRLPGPGTGGLVGGWIIDVLPFLDQKNWRDRITPGIPIATAPDFLLRQPAILRCPIRAGSDGPTAATMDPSHHVFVPHDRRKSFNVFDAPLEARIPWASGPEMTCEAVIRQTGAHKRGFFYASGFQEGAGFIVNGQIVR
jgi:type II secretory pathway pseudopilin PulG